MDALSGGASTLHKIQKDWHLNAESGISLSCCFRKRLMPCVAVDEVMLELNEALNDQEEFNHALAEPVAGAEDTKELERELEELMEAEAKRADLPAAPQHVPTPYGLEVAEPDELDIMVAALSLNDAPAAPKMTPERRTPVLVVPREVINIE